MAYQVTSLGISVLALLRKRRMHGYEMFQTLTARHADRMLKVRPGSLYHAVNRLADEKLIRQTATARNGNRPERTTYELTDAGIDAMTLRLRELVAGPVNECEKFVVGSLKSTISTPPSRARPFGGASRRWNGAPPSCGGCARPARRRVTAPSSTTCWPPPRRSWTG